MAIRLELKPVIVVGWYGFLLLSGPTCADKNQPDATLGSGGSETENNGFSGTHEVSKGGSGENGDASAQAGGTTAGSGVYETGVADSSGVDTVAPSTSCAYETISISGTVNGETIDRDYEITNRSVAKAGTSYDLTKAGRLSLNWNPELSVGLSSNTLQAEIYFPYSDTSFPGAIWCAASGTTTRYKDYYNYEELAIAQVECPGSPVGGNLAINTETVTGMVNGITVSEHVNWILTDPGQVQVDALIIRLEIDDPGKTAPSGRVLSGTFKKDDVYYCVSEGTFERPDPSDDRSMNLQLSDLSRSGTCADLPIRGSLDICVADPWQTDRP